MSERKSKRSVASTEYKSVRLGDASIRRRLATSRFEQPVDIGNVWREQRRLSRERWKLESEEPSAISQLLTKLKSSIPSLIKKVSDGFGKITKRYTKKQALIAGVFPLVLVTAGVVFAQLKNEKVDTPTSLGATTSGEAFVDDGRTTDEPDFKVLYPSDKQELTAVTRRAPSGDLLHTFKDTIDDIEIEVTQQKVPESFKSNEAEQLEKMAKNFLATNIIQIDATTVFHGRNEKSDVQSLFFIKGDSLFSIKSARPLSDDMWAGYIISLQ